MIKALRVTYPSKRLDDPDFKYRPACKTDLSKTFAEARARQRLAQGTNEAHNERQTAGYKKSS